MQKDRGFTLIELLVVVAIIGILAAIAIPQFQAYRQRGYDAGAKSDLRNAATAEEAYFIDNDAYVSCTSVDGTSTGCETSLEGVDSVSTGVTLTMTGTAVTFSGTSTSSSGSGSTFNWNAANGGLGGL